MRVLVINPGGTSTKIAVFDDSHQVFTTNIDVDYDRVRHFARVFDQLDFRSQQILDLLASQGIALDSLDGVVGRGGLMKPLPGGTYQVCEAMVQDLENRIMGEHASNLGAPLALKIAQACGIPAYVVDPVAVDEFVPMARISGLKELPRQSWMHALSQKAVCRTVAQQLGGSYEDYNFIVAHLGSGNSVAAHLKGAMVDGVGGRSDGPFSPERPGGLQSYPLIQLCFSGKYSHRELVKKISNEAGFYDYLGTKDMRLIEARAAQGEAQASEVLEAYYYQVAQAIWSFGAILHGQVDRVILTGGIAHSKQMVSRVSEYVARLAPVEVIPGELEMEALAAGALRVLSHQEEAKDYTKV